MAGTDKKIENILKMSGKERYDYFVHKVVDFEEIWGLNNDGWALLGDDEGNQILPLWPEKEFAQLCAFDQWKGFQPEVIKLDNFMGKWISGMINDKTMVSIFLTPNDKGIVVSPESLSTDLQEELEQYE